MEQATSIQPGESVILHGYFRRYGKIVEVTRTTAKRIYYTSGRRETFTDMDKVAVRAATPQLLLQLHEIERKYDARKAEFLKTTRAELEAECNATILAARASAI